MDDSKTIFASKTFWGIIIGLFGTLLGRFGYTIVSPDQIVLANDLAVIAGAVGSILAIYGRAKASKAVTLLPKKSGA